MRIHVFLIGCLLCFLPPNLGAQDGTDNPFAIQGEKASAAPVDQQTQEAPRPDNPFAIAPPPVSSSAIEQQPEGPLLIRRDDTPTVLDARGRTLGIHVMLLLVMALCWIFFRNLLARCYRALFSEGLFSQLYRERSGGKLSQFILPYLLFFAAAGFFVYLAGQTFEAFPSDQPWEYWKNFSLAILAFFVGKHLLLTLIGWLFPIQVELKQYSFLIMAFGIMTGMLLIPVNLLLSYAPVETTKAILYVSLSLLIILYLLRSIRGMLLSNRLLSNGPLHFLLYICAVEIAPLFILYRLLTG
jgi:hypothetical protein